MTTNIYYNPSGNPGPGADGLSAVLRAEFAAIGLGFGLVPQISTTGLFSTIFAQQGNFAYTLPAAPGTLAMLSDVTTAITTETVRATGAEVVLTTAVGAETVARVGAVGAETTRAVLAEALLAPLVIPTITGLHETAIAMPALNIDCNAATIFTKTITANSTFTVSNVPAAGTSASFVLELTNGGASTVTWWANVKWAGGTAPGLTVAGTDILGFYTINGGTAWRGLALALNIS
jgi:hypothetical protein